MNTDLTGSAPMLRRVSQDRHAGAGWSRHRGLVTAIAVFALLLATVAALGNGGLSYFDLSFLASGGAAGDRRHGRDAGDPDRRLRPVGRRGDLAGQWRWRWGWRAAHRPRRWR